MVATYLYVILIVGPKIMANRKPFKLREVLIAYNGAQVLYSLFMLYEVSALNMTFPWFIDFVVLGTQFSDTKPSCAWP